MNLRAELERRVAAALHAAGAPEDAPAMAAPAARAEFGDYQANGVMAAAKRLKIPPRQLAERTLAELDLSDMAAGVEVAGPGFLNITLAGEFLAARAAEALGDDRLGVMQAASPQTVVVDYSSPNLAKEMHVGHLRTTIIGDALVRALEFTGHRVIRQNHVGDWGTQFGMLLAHMQDQAGEAGEPLEHRLADLEAFYVQAKARFDREPAFADRARRTVTALQGGDAECLAAWRRFTAISMQHCREVYERLGVRLRDEDVRGESAYNEDLPGVAADLDAAGLLTESQGAACVFLDEFTSKEGEPLPVIVRKSDGGFLYATTDLAAIRYRCGRLGADRILYVVGTEQALHLRQVFAVARAAGFAGADVGLEHVAFGMMLGEDRKRFRTRTGGTVKLSALIDEAVRRAHALVAAKSPELPEDQKRAVARAVGVGAVKYADLSQNRNSDYVFSWDKMLSLEGNTAPYMQYAYARVRSIFRKGELEAGWAPGDIRLGQPAERALALRLARLEETLSAVVCECQPNLLCGWLYDLAGAFMTFYETCPVLQAGAEVRASRLALCDLTARAIHTGLGLLGIETPEQM